jgi:hypothetical protein
MVINLNHAKALCLDVPPTLLFSRRLSRTRAHPGHVPARREATANWVG